MSSPLRRVSRLCLIGGMSVSVAAGPALADIPDNLTDLVYQSAEWGNEQLGSRGYTFITSDYHEGQSYEYWWNGSSKTCVQTRAAGGKYEAIRTTSSTDCNQYGSQSNKNDNAAAIALGAAALIGAVALAHKSHERDEKHGGDSQSVAEFDRGYRDGLYHQSYHNYQDTTAYSDGYNAGQRERDEETSHRPSNGRYSGYQQYVSVSDLAGARASSADSELRNRGFRDTGGYKQGSRSYVTWYNQRTRQCIQAVTQDGRIARFEDIDEGNCL